MKLLVIATVIACMTWTFTKEELFKEIRDIFHLGAEQAQWYITRKFMYGFVCDYCFSHWVALFFLAAADVPKVYDSWFYTWIILIWIANLQLGLYSLLRQTIKYAHNKAKSYERR